MGPCIGDAVRAGRAVEGKDIRRGNVPAHRMRPAARFFAALTILVVLSGCAGDDGKPASTPTTTAAPPVATVETGSISGVVMSEEELPIADVDVVLGDMKNVTRTDASGQFVFNGLEPGPYTVLVSRLGFESAARNVEAIAGEVVEVRIELKVLLLKPEPYFVMTPYEGMVQCAFNPYYSVQPCGTVAAEDTDQFLFTTDPTMPLEELVLELVWTPSTPGTAETMELDFCDAHPDRQADVLCLQNNFYEYQTSASPNIMRLGGIPIEEYNEWLVGAGSGFQEATAAVQQRFTIYVTMCFLEECAETYTAIPSA